jgi:hypothetical protein
LSSVITAYNADEIAVIASGPFEISACANIPTAVNYVVQSLDEAIARFNPDAKAKLAAEKANEQEIEKKKAAEEPKKEEPKVEVKPAVKEVLPDTADIVNATKKELQDKQPAPENKQSGWKSKNFLTDDDDLEFDFLDMDDK